MTVDQILNFTIGMTCLTMIFILALIFIILFAKLSKEEQQLKNKKLKLEIKNLEQTLEFKATQKELMFNKSQFLKAETKIMENKTCQY